MKNNSHKLTEAFVPKLPNQLAPEKGKRGRPRKYFDGQERPRPFGLFLEPGELLKLERIANARYAGNRAAALRAALEAFPE